MDALVSDFVRRAAALPPHTDYDSLTAKYKLQRRKQLEMVAQALLLKPVKCSANRWGLTLQEDVADERVLELLTSWRMGTHSTRHLYVMARVANLPRRLVDWKRQQLQPFVVQSCTLLLEPKRVNFAINPLEDLIDVLHKLEEMRPAAPVKGCWLAISADATNLWKKQFTRCDKGC